MSGTDSLIAELRGHLEHGISSEAIEAAADAIATLTAERDQAQKRVQTAWNAFGPDLADDYEDTLVLARAADGDLDEQITALVGQRDRAESERDALREALAPFGQENDLPENLPAETRLNITFAGMIVAHATFGDFRRARALAKGECE